MSRQPSWFGMFWRDYGYVALLLGFITLGCTYFSVTQFAQARTVAEDGVPMWGRVEGRRKVETETGTQYLMTYRFRLPEGDVVRDVVVTEAFYNDRTNFISQINVVTDDPTLIAEEQAQLVADGRRMQQFALLAGLAALGMGFWSGRNATSAVMARRWGMEEDAYVTERIVSYSSKSPPKAFIRFRSHSGVDGRSFQRMEMWFPNVDRGDLIRVFTYRGQAWWLHDTGPRPEMLGRVPLVRRMFRRQRDVPVRNRHGS